jgi:hypothetical protein
MMKQQPPSSSYAHEIVHEFEKTSAGFFPKTIEHTGSYGTKHCFLISHDFPVELKPESFVVVPPSGTQVRDQEKGNYIVGGKAAETAERQRIAGTLREEIEASGGEPITTSEGTSPYVWLAVAGALSVLIGGTFWWMRPR